MIRNMVRTLGVAAAPFYRRLLADLIDLTLLVGVGWLLWGAGVIKPSRLPPSKFDWVDYTADLLANHLGLFYPALIAMLSFGVLYALVTRVLLGRTLGELLMGLRLIDLDGDPAGPLRALAHAGGTMLGLALLLLGYVWAAVDHNRQGLAEYLSGTRLVAGEVELRR